MADEADVADKANEADKANAANEADDFDKLDETKNADNKSDTDKAVEGKVDEANAMVNKFIETTQNTNKTQLLPSDYGTFDP